MRVIAAFLSTLLAVPAAWGEVAEKRSDRYADQLTIAGASTFTLAWGAMTIAGTTFAIPSYGSDGRDAGLAFLPVVGPFVFGGGAAASHDDPSAAGVALLCFFDGAVQVTGIALMIAGAVRRHRVGAR